MKYKHKPTEVEAFQWTGGPDQTEDPEWIVRAMENGMVEVSANFLKVKTGTGVAFINPGDYIIKNGHGEIYPCPIDVFEESYELTEASN